MEQHSNTLQPHVFKITEVSLQLLSESPSMQYSGDLLVIRDTSLASEKSTVDKAVSLMIKAERAGFIWIDQPDEQCMIIRTSLFREIGKTDGVDLKERGAFFLVVYNRMKILRSWNALRIGACTL